MPIYGWILVVLQIATTLGCVILHLRLRSQVQNLVEDIHYYRWFNHALTLLVRDKKLTNQMQQAVEAETKIAGKIVGG